MAKATTIRELLVRIGVKTDTKSVAKFDAALGKAKRGMAATAMVAAGLTAAIVAMAGSMLLLAGSAAHVGDEIGKASKRAMTGAEDFQGLAFAAGEAGVSVGSLENALKKQLVSLGSAKQGLKASVDAFKTIGLSLEDASKLGQRDLFLRIADGLNAIEDDAVRARASMDIFGRAGLDLGPLLATGADGINQAANAAARLGLILDNESIAATERYVDSMGRLTGSIGAFKNKVGVVIIEALLPIIDAINNFTMRNQKLVDVLVDLTPMVLALVTAIAGLASIGVVLASLGFLASGLVALVSVVGSVAAALGVGLLPFLAILSAALVQVAIPIAVVVAGFIAAGLVIDDVLTALRGGDSVLGRFLARWLETDGVLGSVASILVDMVAGFQAVFTIVQNVGAILLDFGSILMNLGLDWVRLVLEDIVNLLGFVFGVETGPLLTAFEALEVVIDKVLQGLQAAASISGQLSGISGGLSESISQGGFSALGDAASGAISNVSNSISQTITNTITGTDPVRIGEEIRRFMDAQNRRAAAAFSGGIR